MTTTSAPAQIATSSDPSIVAIGVNCTPPEYIADLVRSAAQATDKPILTYPNSGEHFDAETKTWHGQSCADYTAQAREWFNAGAKVIGGCCRTTPEHIRELALSLRGSLQQLGMG